MRTNTSAITICAFALALLGGAGPAEAKGKHLSKLLHPVRTFRDVRQGIGQRRAAFEERVKRSWVGQKWQNASPRTKKWIKRGAIGLGVVAAVAAAPYLLGGSGAVLSGAGNVLSTVGSAGVVKGASALAGKALVGGGAIAVKGATAVGGYALHSAVPLAIGGYAVHRWHKRNRAGKGSAPAKASSTERAAGPSILEVQFPAGTTWNSGAAILRERGLQVLSGRALKEYMRGSGYGGNLLNGGTFGFPSE